MFKFLVVLFLIIYIISKVGGFIFRTFFSAFGGETAQSNPYGRQGARKPADGNVHIDYNPKTKEKGTNFKGGDYVKYEDVD